MSILRENLKVLKNKTDLNKNAVDNLIKTNQSNTKSIGFSKKKGKKKTTLFEIEPHNDKWHCLWERCTRKRSY